MGPYEQAVRTAMDLTDQGQAPEQAVRAQRLSMRTFRQGRYMVLLSEDGALGEDDRATARRAIDAMERDGHTGKAWELVKDLVTLRFGPPSTRKVTLGMNVSDLVRYREAEFNHAFDAVTNVCAAADHIHVPILAAEDAAELKRRLEHAQRQLRELRRRIEEATR